MTEETPKNDNEKIRITYEEAVKFFTNIAPDEVCPVCSHSTFSIAGSFDEGEGQVVMVLMVSPLPTFRKLGGRTTVQVECEKCGYLKFHNAVKIRKWLDENSATPPEDEQE